MVGAHNFILALAESFSNLNERHNQLSLETGIAVSNFGAASIKQ